MHANNETGIIQPIREIGEELASGDVYFHVDAARSCGKLVDELRSVRYDMLSLTGHKMYAPQGIGALVIRNCGFGKMCGMIAGNHEEYWDTYNKTKAKILGILDASGMEYHVNGDERYCLPNTINISLMGIDSEALMIQTKKWCAISNGSACNAKSYDYSYVLRAMGLSEERMRSALRISWGKEELDLSGFGQMINTAAKML